MRLTDRVMIFARMDPLKVYQAADALLLPSAREGFSLVCAEAMSVGVPVLRTRTAGTAQLIQEGVTGRSVAIDRDAFIAGAIEFLGDREPLQRMGSAASQHVLDHFSLDRQVDQTRQLYARLVGASHTA